MEFETGKELYFENLISLRIKGMQAEINAAIMALNQYLKSNSIEKVGPAISTTFSVEQNCGQAILDMEVLIPVDKPVAPGNGYIFKPKFHLVNAAYVRHEGRPEKFQETCNQLPAYLQANSLQNITSVYTVMVKEPEMVNGEISDMVADMYIGINPSTL